MKHKNILGLMSGTSMDGIDASIIRTDGISFERTGINLIFPYSSHAKKIFDTYNQDPGTFMKNNYLLNKLDNLVTKDHISCVNQILKKSDLRPEYIGFHGQTIFHDPQIRSIQLGSGQVLAKSTNIKVICNFRANDIKNGGHGAPIAPIYHKAIIEKINSKLPTSFINIGGVSNISFWDGNKLIGFDVGPGNALIDAFVKKRLNLNFDNEGKIASTGLPNQSVIKKFLNDEYFTKQYPKSLDKFYFDYIFNDNIFKSLNTYDALCTLTHLTVQSIIVALDQLPGMNETLIISGGGQHNKYLIKELKSNIRSKTLTSNELNIPGDMIEAEMMAYLTARSVRKLKYTFPDTTGTKKPCTGGDLFYP